MTPPVETAKVFDAYAPPQIAALVEAAGIGRVHAANVAAHPEADLVYIVDPDERAARVLAKRLGSTAVSDATAAARNVDAFLIASPTATHCRLIELAAEHGCAIFRRTLSGCSSASICSEMDGRAGAACLQRERSPRRWRAASRLGSPAPRLRCGLNGIYTPLELTSLP